MSKRRYDEAGFWKPTPNPSTSAFQANDESTSSSSPYVFNFSRSPLSMQKQTLPITKHKRQIVYALEHYSIIIIVGETGSGKSTQIPQILYDHGWCDDGYSIVCTQPRRIAAQTISQRVSQEMHCPLGSTVGYKVRFDDKTTPQTSIKYVTDGMLLREATLSSDPLLSQYSVIMIDEAHERNVNTDVLLGIVKKIWKKRKDGLRVIICSATIDAKTFLDFFIPEKVRKEYNRHHGANDSHHSSSKKEKKRKRRWGKVGEANNNDDVHGDDDKHQQGNSEKSNNTASTDTNTEDLKSYGTIISIDGRQHPVDILHVQEAVADYVKATVDTALRIHFDLKHDDGDILAFLPSGEDIDRAIQFANDSLAAGSFTDDRNGHKKRRKEKEIVFYPLYGSLPYQMQSKVFQPKMGSDTTRRVIFATNIAETSVTVPHISSVIDCGYVKMPFYDTETGFDRLVISPISIASARQVCTKFEIPVL